MRTAGHLAFREIWRNRTRFLLFSLVIALITVLILFIAALGEGLGSGNREYLEKLNADLIVYQDTARLSIASSRLGCETRNVIRSVDGVRDVGAIGFAGASIPMPGRKAQDISLIGVEPGQPGEPPTVTGRGLVRKGGDEVIIDRTIALMTKLEVGEWLTIRTPQGIEDEYFALQVVGISDSRKYGLRPSVFVPLTTWDRVRPQGSVGTDMSDVDAPACNVAAVQLEDPTQIEYMRETLKERVGRIDAVDPKTAYESTPGYSEQQSTLNTQNGFALLIGILVIGGFFQIQTLQKVAQIGMLKAIGTSDFTVAWMIIVQIVVVNILGVIIGGLVTLGLTFSFPPNIPIVFEPGSGALALGSILLIGPIGGLVSVRYALGVEPLTALGLSS